MADAGDKLSKVSEANRRAQILRAAERLFLHYGYGKTTVADIAREAAVAVGSVYLEFASKEAIAADLAACRYNGVRQRLTDIAAGTGSHAERLQQCLTHRVRAFVDIAKQGEHSCDLLSCTQSAAQAYCECELDIIAGLLQRGQASGEFCAAAGHPAMPRLLLRVYDGLAAPGRRPSPEARTDNELETLLNLTHQLAFGGLLNH